MYFIGDVYQLSVGCLLASRYIVTCRGLGGPPAQED